MLCLIFDNNKKWDSIVIFIKNFIDIVLIMIKIKIENVWWFLIVLLFFVVLWEWGNVGLFIGKLLGNVRIIIFLKLVFLNKKKMCMRKYNLNIFVFVWLLLILFNLFKDYDELEKL